MTAQYTMLDYEIFAVLVVGGLCALWIRNLPASPKRGWVKLAAFLLIGSSIISYGAVDSGQEQKRSITPVKISGILTNLHTVTPCCRQSPTQHYNVDTGTGTALADLYDNDAVFFMKAQDSERVEVVFTRESGYVSHLRIIDGPNKGYEFNEPDTRNTTPPHFFMIVGAVSAIVGIFKWIVDHNADPALEG